MNTISLRDKVPSTPWIMSCIREISVCTSTATALLMPSCLVISSSVGTELKMALTALLLLRPQHTHPHGVRVRPLDSA